jgi:hypothetical protein
MYIDDIGSKLDAHLRYQIEPELLLLKGHLLLEQCVNELLRLYIRDAAQLERLNLTFSRKLDLLHALGHRFPNTRFGSEDKVREINRIRNRLAHQLEFPGLDGELKSWACSVLGQTPKTLNRRATYASTVRKAFYMVIAFLAGVAQVKHAMIESP